MSACSSGKLTPPTAVVALGIVAVAVFFGFAAGYEWLPSGYWKRYSKDTFFFDDFAIDSEGRFWASGIMSFINTAVNQYVRQNMNGWINNCKGFVCGFRCVVPRFSIGRSVASFVALDDATCACVLVPLIRTLIIP